MVGFPRSENDPRVLSAPPLPGDYERLRSTPTPAALVHLDPPVAAAAAAARHTVIADLGRITELSIDKLLQQQQQQQQRGSDNPALDLTDDSDPRLRLPTAAATTTTTKDGSPQRSYVEPAIVKKIAAGLRSSYLGDATGSLSSGSSVITIASVANSEPGPYDEDDEDDEEEDEDEGRGDGRNPKRKKKKRKARLITDEPWYTTALEISVPFFIAGIGTIGAGVVLAEVTQWKVFKEVSQILILVPALLGLKGNLDMCLASRLSTQANLGNMKGCREIGKMILGNIALVQVQAIVAAALVACFATLVGWLMAEGVNFDHSLLMMAASIVTATTSCFVLDFAMIAIIMGAKCLHMNPDNLATPLAASIGDLVSISLLSQVVSQLYARLETEPWILYAVIAAYLLLLPVWVIIVLKNKYTKRVLTSGWLPVISALFISGLGGLILNQVVERLPGFVVFQPIINGIGGNLVSVQASRISTMFHQTSVVGILPPITSTWVSPFKAIFHGVPSAKTARLLVGMAVLGHTIFSLIADQVADKTIDGYFMLAYLTMAVGQVMLLLYIAHLMIHVMWRCKLDPDNSAIPYLTALGDLLGSLFLAAAFLFLRAIGKEYHRKS